MLPMKKGGTKRKRAASPTSSEQEFLDALPDAGDLVSRTEQKSPSDVKPAYLIYVVLRTLPDKIPDIVIRKAYESKTDGVEAFKREYVTWVKNLYPPCHTEEELSRAHLINLMEEREAETGVAHVYAGRGKVEYEIVHRDDKQMDNQDPRQRKIVIVCEETRWEAA